MCSVIAFLLFLLIILPFYSTSEILAGVILVLVAGVIIVLAVVAEQKKKREAAENGTAPLQAEPPKVHCPRCGATALTARRRGFSERDANTGYRAHGFGGIVLGYWNKDDIIVTCDHCGQQGRLTKKQEKQLLDSMRE